MLLSRHNYKNRRNNSEIIRTSHSDANFDFHEKKSIFSSAIFGHFFSSFLKLKVDRKSEWSQNGQKFAKKPTEYVLVAITIRLLSKIMKNFILNKWTFFRENTNSHRCVYLVGQAASSAELNYIL